METFDFIEMKVPAKAAYISAVRLSISGIATRVGFSYEEIEDLKVAISEAITNAVEHGYDGDQEGEVTVGFGIYDDRLEVIVADRGGSFDLEQVKRGVRPYKGTESAEELQTNGLGLVLIESLMDQVDIKDDDGAIVLMTKYLNEAEVGVDDNQIPTTR